MFFQRTQHVKGLGTLFPQGLLVTLVQPYLGPVSQVGWEVRADDQLSSYGSRVEGTRLGVLGSRVAGTRQG